MSDREAMKLALEALEFYHSGEDYFPTPASEAITALRTALAVPKQEPVAWMVYTLDGKSVCVTDNPSDFTDQHRALPLYTALAAPRPEPVAWMYVNSEGECEQIEYGTEAIDDDSITPLYAAPPTAAPQPESKTPAWWMDGLTATLMREGVNKHRAREIAVGYWEAYCQIPGTEEDKT